MKLEVLFTPADFAALKQRDLSGTNCVVFDVLRATTTMVTALQNGASGVIPVEGVPEALVIHQHRPEVLLAGERDGLRIPAELTGTVGFHLGNSPREFTREAVNAKTIVMTTTNGTRALRACAHARFVTPASFRNLEATAAVLKTSAESDVLVICGGTFDEAAYEDVLAAGALCDRLWQVHGQDSVADSALMSRDLYLAARGDLAGALGRSRNGRRLLSRPELREDVAFCAQRDVSTLVAALGKDGVLRAR